MDPTSPRSPHRPSFFNNTTPQSTLSSRRSHLSPSFQAKLHQMALQLAPLVQLTTGLIHPSFPSTLLNFWLLTESQLDELAHFYHQRTPSVYTSQYPCPVYWPSEGMTIEDKRRKLGRFIGLRGCESPVRTDEGEGEVNEEVQEMMGWDEQRIREEIRRRLEKEREEELARGKMGGWRRF
ncbi:hypothetical protein B0T21DRAFT_439528 [Apiosordaria backusii]|uniref:Uncharacterized protein n=1 Tax=Apiosordaria backusii TaxID=314023 RepID=A0AA40BNM7_9PEZI|nr:hypothetical protein B0T21DRAFT_439528 [Apiosordaria backusii]